MANNFKQDGRVMSLVAAAAVASSAVVKAGNVLGVALNSAAIGETVSVAVEGVFEVPKVTAAVIAQGESLVWDVSAAKFDDNLATPAAGDVFGASAFAFAAAGNGATTVLVKFTGCPGTVA